MSKIETWEDYYTESFELNHVRSRGVFHMTKELQEEIEERETALQNFLDEILTTTTLNGRRLA